MRIGIIIQARAGSTRLPGKVMLPLAGKTTLHHVVERSRLAAGVHEVMVATTEDPSDDITTAHAQELGVPVFRGSVNDVLSRFYGAARERNYDAFVRLTADCPCHDPKVLTQAVTNYRHSGFDYYSNTIERTFPHGYDFEIASFAALERAHREATEPMHREHVMPYLYRTGLFRVGQMLNTDMGGARGDIRVTLDTADDYALLSAVFAMLPELFTLRELVALFERHPALARVNSTVEHKKQFDTIEQEMEEAVKLLQRQDLHRAADLLKGMRP